MKQLEARLDVLDGMNRALGKVTNVLIRLKNAKEPKEDLEEIAKHAKTIDKLRRDLLRQIEKLQGQIADEWTVGAATLAQKLREENGEVQTRIRNIKKKVNVAENAVAIIGQIDDAIAFLKKVPKSG